MIDLASAATAAALLNNSVAAIDKVYNWWKATRGEKPASMGLRSDPQKQVLQYVPLTSVAQPARVVMTYADLASRLDQSDLNFIRSFENRMAVAMSQWEALNARLPLSDPVDRARIEANMEDMKNRDICHSLRQIVDFIDRRGIDLMDHYQSVRTMCPV